MSDAATNGRPQRKQLSDQIAKLEALLDGLAEGLNDAIADACKEGTRTAVKESIAEVLAHPDLRTLTRPPAAAPSRPSFWSRVKATVAEVKAAVTTVVARAATVVTSRCQSAGEVVTTAARNLRTAWRLRRLMQAGLGVGAVAMIHTAPHFIATAVTGIQAACVAAVIAAWLWVQERTRRIRPA